MTITNEQATIIRAATILNDWSTIMNAYPFPSEFYTGPDGADFESKARAALDAYDTERLTFTKDQIADIYTDGYREGFQELREVGFCPCTEYYVNSLWKDLKGCKG